MATTEIATVEAGGYLALNHSTEEVQDIIKSNLGGKPISPLDLPGLGIPAGGATTWEVETVAGTQSVRELEGVIIHFKAARAYWPGEFQGSKPPQCSSSDGFVGVGDPGGTCETCPLNQYGSDNKAGRGKACKEMEQWFLLTDGALLPMVLTLPPTSLRAAAKYRMALSSAALPMWKVVTKIGLTKLQNPDGQAYGQIVPTLGGRLSDDDAQRARAYADMLRPVLERAPAVHPAQDGGAPAEAAA